MTKKLVGEERVYSPYTSMLLFISKDRTGAHTGQEAGAEQCFTWEAEMGAQSQPFGAIRGKPHPRGWRDGLVVTLLSVIAEDLSLVPRSGD